MRGAKLEIILSTLFLVTGGVVFFVLGDRPAQAQRYFCADFVRNRIFDSEQDQTTTGALAISCRAWQEIDRVLADGGFYCVDFGRNDTFFSTFDESAPGDFGVRCFSSRGNIGNATRPGIPALW